MMTAGFAGGFDDTQFTPIRQRLVHRSAESANVQIDPAGRKIQLISDVGLCYTVAEQAPKGTEDNKEWKGPCP